MNTFLEKWDKELHAEYYSLEKPITDKKTYDELIEYVPMEAKAILDIGAGDGYIVRELAKRSKTMVRGISICKDDCMAYDLTDMDMHNLLFSDKIFNVVVSRHTLEHALSPRLVIREAWRVLRDDGLFLIEVPINHEGIEGCNRAHFYCFTPRQWDSMMIRNGFTLEKTEFSCNSYRLICKKGEMKEI